MKKVLFLFLFVMGYLTAGAYIQIVLTNKTEPKAFPPTANKTPFTTKITKIEYNSTTKDSLSIGHYGVATSTEKKPDTCSYSYFMFANGKNINSYMYSADAIEGYYVREVKFKTTSGTGLKNPSYIRAYFSKNATASSISEIASFGTHTKIDSSKLYTFGNEDHSNLYWNISVKEFVNVQLDSIWVTYCNVDGSEDEDFPVVPEPVEKQDTLSVKAAIDTINNSKNKLWEHESYVVGTVISLPVLYSGKASFFITDTAKEHLNLQLQAYKISKPDGSDFDSQEDLDTTIHFGDIVLIRANKLKYYVHSSDPTKNKNEIEEGKLVKPLASQSLMQVAIDSGFVTMDRVEGNVTIKMNAKANLNNTPIPNVLFQWKMNLQNDFKNEYRAIAGNYEKTGVNISVNMPGMETEIPAAYFHLWLTYISSDANHVNSYKVRMCAYDAQGRYYCYATGDTIVIKGSDQTGASINFSIDNGTSVRKLTVAKAVQMAKALAENATTDESFYVYGYCTGIAKDFASGQENFYMSDTDDPSESNRPLYIFQARCDSAIKVGDLVKAFGPLQNYKGNTCEIPNGTAVIIDRASLPNDLEQPEVIRLDTISANQAYEIGMALNNSTSGKEVSTTKEYVIIGVCTGVSTKYGWDPQKKTETWYMANDSSEYGNFQCYSCMPDREVVKGDTMLVVGKIFNYCGTSSKDQSLYNTIEVKSLSAVHVSGMKIPSGTSFIPEVIISSSHETAVKYREEGQIVIIRNGVKYNILGKRVR